jgi:hypothetical protein
VLNIQLEQRNAHNLRIWSADRGPLARKGTCHFWVSSSVCRHHDVEKMGYMFRRPVHGSAGVDIGESENDDREECRRPI